MAKQQPKGSIQATRMSKALGDQQEPGHGSGSVFKAGQRINEPDNLPRVGKKSYKEETKGTPEIKIIVPKLSVVNQRIFCVPVTSQMQLNQDTGIYEPVPTTKVDKAGNFKELPRFFVAKCAQDIFVETKDGPKHLELPVGTEIFPFWPEAEEWSFPQVYDTSVKVRYTVFHWTELAGYLIPDDELKVVK